MANHDGPLGSECPEGQGVSVARVSRSVPARLLTPNGYRLTVACPCNVTFELWISPDEAAGDLVMLARLN